MGCDIYILSWVFAILMFLRQIACHSEVISTFLICNHLNSSRINIVQTVFGRTLNTVFRYYSIELFF